jgi:hypothetical protein
VRALGVKKLRRLAALTGLPLDAATSLSGLTREGVVWIEGGCIHYAINGKTGAYKVITKPCHWGSCPPDWMSCTSPDCG